MRNFGSGVVSVLLNPNFQYRFGYPNSKITLTDVKVLRRRHDANIPCNPDADNQDNLFHKAAVKEFGCMPPYWKSIMNQTQTESEVCRNSTQLKTAFDYFKSVFIKDRKITLSNNEAPCTEMSVSSKLINEVKHKQSYPAVKKKMTITFRYQEDQYRETINSKEYTFEDLLANSGGYIGMFLGFGLLQIPQLIYAYFSYLAQMTKHIMLNKS